MIGSGYDLGYTTTYLAYLDALRVKPAERRMAVQVRELWDGRTATMHAAGTMHSCRAFLVVHARPLTQDEAFAAVERRAQVGHRHRAVDKDGDGRLWEVSFVTGGPPPGEQ